MGEPGVDYGYRSTREIRVFISSTFHDMQRERELLVKQVFPELRRVCDERFVTLTEVDLRWGITAEQAAEGQVLPICLDEIVLSRPYFIGLLGERYGWVPRSLPADVIAKEPWLEAHVDAGTSVTELEVLHGVLNNPDAAARASFYFRDPGYTNSVSDAERRLMTEHDDPDDVRVSGAEEAARRTAARRVRLVALKQRIRDSGLPVVENYPDPAALATAVRDHLLAVIDELYPADAIPDPLDHEAHGHDRYAARKLLAFVSRPAHTGAVDAFVATVSSGNGLVLTGDSGAGKTALLADWVRLARNRHPDAIVVPHYFGATPDSAQVGPFLRRLLGEMKRRFAIADEVPLDPQALRDAVPFWLAQTSGRSFVLVLDALNQIEGDEPDRRLAWLPRHLLESVRIIASTLPGPALDALRERGWAEHELTLPDADERGQMIDVFFGHYRKVTGSRLRRQLAAAPGSANPLFLRTVLEELRQFGHFEELPAKVAEYLSAATPAELFGLVIRRWQQDFDAGRDLVRHAARHLWAARQGLSEFEWMELLSLAGEPLPRQAWSPLFVAMEPHLTVRGGVYAFGHEFLRDAVKTDFVPTEKDRRAAHIALADYFGAQEVTRRVAAELPWQLRAAGARRRLQKTLLDIPVFVLVDSRDRNELMDDWCWLGRERSMGPSYLESFERWSATRGPDARLPDVANRLALFLMHAGLYRDAESAFRRALAAAEQAVGADHPAVAAILSGMGGLLLSMDRSAEAESLYRKALATSVRTEGKDHPSTARDLNNLAWVLKETNRPQEAEPLYRRALALVEHHEGPNHPHVALALNNLAGLLFYSYQDASKAEPLYRRALAIDEERLGLQHPTVARDLNNLAGLLMSRQQYGEAETLQRRAIAIVEHGLGREHPTLATDLPNLAQLLILTQRLPEADTILRRALAIGERALGEDHPHVGHILRTMAGLTYASGRLEEAERLLHRNLKIMVKSTLASSGGTHPQLQKSLGHYAGILHEMGRSDSQISEIIRELEPELFADPAPPPEAQSPGELTLHALQLFKEGRLEEAEPLMRQVLKMIEETVGPDHPDVAAALCNLAQVVNATKGLTESEPLMRKALDIDEHRLGPDHPNVARDLHNLSLFLIAASRLQDAEPMLRRACLILMQASGMADPNTGACLTNYGRLLQVMGYGPDQIRAALRRITGSSRSGNEGKS